MSLSAIRASARLAAQQQQLHQQRRVQQLQVTGLRSALAAAWRRSYAAQATQEAPPKAKADSDDSAAAATDGVAAAAASGADGGAAATAAATAAELAEAKKKVEELKKEAADFKDKYVRSLAEIENARKRSVQQVENARQHGIQKFAKSLLDVADTLDMATEAVPQDELPANETLANLYEGVTLTARELERAFRQNGLVRFHPLGQKFDPNRHEAVFQLENDGMEPGHVGAVTKVGYALNDRTIRPAVVGVVKAGEK